MNHIPWGTPNHCHKANIKSHNPTKAVVICCTAGLHVQLALFLFCIFCSTFRRNFKVESIPDIICAGFVSAILGSTSSSSSSLILLLLLLLLLCCCCCCCCSLLIIPHWTKPNKDNTCITSAGTSLMLLRTY